MWFKNCRAYHLLQPLNLSEDQMHDQLQADAFRPCGSLDLDSQGWVSPLGRTSDRLVHELQGCMMVCARQESKVLPTAVVSEALEEKCVDFETAEGRKPSRRQRNEWRDDIIHQLLPRAFTKSSMTFAMIDKQQGWILVDASSANRAEALITLLRETLGSLPVRPMETVLAPPSVLTGWIRQVEKYPDFQILDSCELQDSLEGGGVIRCKGQDLESTEIQAHLDAGKQVMKLAVEWDQRIACLIESDLTIKRIKFLDLIQEEVADVATDDEIALFDTIFSLMILEFRRLIPRLLDIMGGVRQDES